MIGSEIVCYTRELLADQAEPYLWSDARLLAYIQEAERLFCAKTHWYIDDTYSFDTAVGVSTYSLPPRGLKVLELSSGGTVMKALTAPSSAVRASTAEGVPTGYVSGWPTKTVVLYPKPDDIYTIDVVMAAMPEYAVDMQTESVVPIEWQQALADFAAYKALLTNDVDGNNVGTAQTFEQRWEQSLIQAKRELYQFRTADRVAQRPWTGGKY